MMNILATVLKRTLASKLLPAGLLGTLLTVGHQWWQERDARIVLEEAKNAKQVCQAEQQLVMVNAQLAAARAERDKAAALVRKTQEAVEFERQVQDEVRAERKAIKEEFDAFKLASGSDPRCLSDGVLKLLGGHGPVGDRSDKR